LQKELGVSVQLAVGKPGQFDVVADGKLVFSKATEGRFPDPDEVVGELE
jgi:selT/selW/selH-like putative selenoprotein